MVNKEFKKYLILLEKNLYKDLDVFFQSVPLEIIKQKEFFDYALQITGESYKYAGLEIKENIKYLIQALKNDKWGRINEHIPDLLITEEEVIKLLLQNIGSLKTLFEKLDLSKEINQYYLIESLKYDVNRFSYFPEYLKNDRSFFIRAVKSNGGVMHYATDYFKDDDEVVIEAVKTSGHSILNASKRLQQNKLIALEAIKVESICSNNCYSIFYHIIEFRSDKQLILEALKNGAYFNFFELISDDLKSNVDFAIEVLKINPKTISNNDFTNKYITHDAFVIYLLNNLNLFDDGITNVPQLIISKYSKNKDIILNTLEYIKGYDNYNLRKAFQNIDEIVKKDNGFFKDAVAINGLFLEFGGIEVKRNFEIVLDAIKENGLSIYFANEELQKNETLIIEAIKNGSGTKILTPELSSKENLTIALTNLSKLDSDNNLTRYCSIMNASQILKNDRGFCLIAIKEDGLNIKYISDNLLKDIELVHEAFKNSRGLNLFFHDHRLNIFSGSKELVLELIKSGAKPLENVSNELKDDFDVVINAVSNNGSQLKYASDRLKEHPQIIQKAIEKDSTNFEFASYNIKSNIDFVSEVIKNTKYHIRSRTSPILIKENREGFEYIPNLRYILQFCTNEVLSSKELMIEAVKKEGSLLEFISDSLKSDKDVVMAALHNTPKKDILKLASKKLQEDLDLLILILK